MKIIKVFVTLGSLNFDRVVKFYDRLFEISPHIQIPHQYAEFDLPGLRLGIFHPKAADSPEFSQSARSGMSLCVEVENLEASIDRLSELGYPPPGEISIASHGREIYAYDPDGNRLILHEEMRR
ncbi:MAG: VOC family protein [Cyanobacteria bacterium SID2]|nr:VOC family protein [Cyanobacteria bacterium SID2]MBP0003975.1 VOC family protein [Cyanobacteria bacterium SBC]